jgi:hypothetical protein
VSAAHWGTRHSPLTQAAPLGHWANTSHSSRLQAPSAHASGSAAAAQSAMPEHGVPAVGSGASQPASSRYTAPRIWYVLIDGMSYL